MESAEPLKFDLSPGLLEYYSSQAESMLSQFNNINRLLGPTHNWTPSGDFCEQLLREFLRRFLPPNLSVDKGFFYGRTSIDEQDTHCPEIDVLIHDSADWRPILRIGDFVIVNPQAVRGMIQVKRTFSKSQVRRGLENVVVAKQHLLNVLWREEFRGWSKLGGLPRVFTGVIGFEDEIGNDCNFYAQHLLRWSSKLARYNRPVVWPTNMLVLPNFVGSLTGTVIASSGPNIINPRYFLLKSIHNNRNVCIQALLERIMSALLFEPEKAPPYSFPQDWKPLSTFYVVRIKKAEFDRDGITIHRNDSRSFHYQPTDGRMKGGEIHLELVDGKLVVTDCLAIQTNPQELFVKTQNGIDSYSLVGDLATTGK
jgi:hypothetical protein